ncbi:MAG: hypothetical protein HGA76_08110 [Candidatus Firestonebacteria bacterium]|nr:hypothetical protein [Candidatus Firestonebacteria bacterium]
MVESGTTSSILNNPRHPYTYGLLNSIPRLGTSKSRLVAMPGQQSNPAERPLGCPFHPRCSKTEAICRNENPRMTEENGTNFACWHPMATL